MEDTSKPGVLTQRERLDGLLALHAQARQRFSEVEGIEWRVNFATWAFLGGVAYLFKPSTPPVSVPPHSAMVGFVVVLVVLHLASLIMLNRSAYHQRLWADYYRDGVKAVLSVPNESLPPPKWNEPMPGRYKAWITVESCATLLLALTVASLIW